MIFIISQDSTSNSYQRARHLRDESSRMSNCCCCRDAWGPPARGDASATIAHSGYDRIVRLRKQEDSQAPTAATAGNLGSSRPFSIFTAHEKASPNQCVFASTRSQNPLFYWLIATVHILPLSKNIQSFGVFSAIVAAIAQLERQV